MSKAALDRRIGALQAAAPKPAGPDPVLIAAERWFEQALGCTFDELDTDDIWRVEQLLHEAPDFAHPLLLQACLARPEDREPAMPEGQWCRQVHGQVAQWVTPDTPEWRARQRWQRRRWGYDTASSDPEAQELCARLEAWATAPDRPYLRGADLRLLFARLGVEWGDMGYFALRRLVDLCAALDELARACSAFEAPPALFWAVLGWAEHHPKRHRELGARS